MKFLVVDDSPVMRRIVVDCLHRLGYEMVDEAEDGTEGLRRFEPSVGCVITDWSMPNMTGADFIRRLRASPAGETVPVLMLTSRRHDEDLLAAMEAGVSDCLVKPFTPIVLREKLDQILDPRAAA